MGLVKEKYADVLGSIEHLFRLLRILGDNIKSAGGNESHLVAALDWNAASAQLGRQIFIHANGVIECSATFRLENNTRTDLINQIQNCEGVVYTRTDKRFFKYDWVHHSRFVPSAAYYVLVKFNPALKAQNRRDYAQALLEAGYEVPGAVEMISFLNTLGHTCPLDFELCELGSVCCTPGEGEGELMGARNNAGWGLSLPTLTGTVKGPHDEDLGYVLARHTERTLKDKLILL